MHLFVAEGYYDYSSQSDPIKYRINSDISVPILLNGAITHVNKIRTNQV